MLTVSTKHGWMRSRDGSRSMLRSVIRSAVPDFAYIGEVALGIVLHDPSGELASLHGQSQAYPGGLADALVERLWEADFLIGGVRKSLQRADPVWVAACLARAVLLCAHALHGRAGRWLINEKGAVDSAARLCTATADFGQRARNVLDRLGKTPAELAESIESADQLLQTTRADCQPSQ